MFGVADIVHASSDNENVLIYELPVPKTLEVIEAKGSKKKLVMSDKNSSKGKIGTQNEERSGEPREPETPKISLRKKDKPSSSGKKPDKKSKLQIVGFNARRPRKPVHFDENTTDSENSEGNNLLSDVDWEGNLDNDAQLDEFAPRRRLEESPSPTPQLANKISDLIMTSTSLNASRASFEAGEKVKVHNYNTSSWEEGVVEEMDDVEQEVLVVSNGRKEWLSINSHRISKLSIEDLAESSGPSSVSAQHQLFLDDIMGTPRTESHTKAKPQLDTTPVSAKSESKERESPKTKLAPQDSMYFRSRRDRLKRSKPKRNESSSVASSSKAPEKSKFEENEKVLAKWSNHRMQKFPAVIRRVYGNGDYDVLFYDGFEKTISEDNIYKVTEEECAKYQGANPSLADSFVEMDDDSKEARRQRKKKIFDDYLSPKDFERPRKKIPAESGGVRRILQQKRSVGAKRLQTTGFKLLQMPKRRRFTSAVKPSVEGLQASESSSEAELAGPSPAKVPSPVKDTSQQEQPPPSEQKTPQPVQDQSLVVSSGDVPPDQHPPATSTPVPNEETLPIPATPAGANASPVKTKPEEAVPGDPAVAEPPASSVGSPGPAKKETPVTPAAQPRQAPFSLPPPDYGERFLCDIPEGATPVVIKTKDCLLHRSIIIGDRNLLPGWVKHAVLIRGKYQVFLISPEGYKLNTRLDLQDFYSRTLKMPAPPVLDFVFDMTVINDLREKQKDMEVPALRYPTWKIKKGKGGAGRGRRPGPAKMNKFKNPVKTGPKVGKVRTLLPKYRYVAVPLEPPEPEKEVVWNCPKEDCGKTFRKESLLQMHIKHYHAELKPLVGFAPNVADLATARSESHYPETLKPQLMPMKRPSKTSPQVGLTEKNDSEYSSSPAQGSVSPHVGTSFTDDLLQARPGPPKRMLPLSLEEKKPTIKTLLPLRQPTLESQNSVTAESDDYDSEDEFKLTSKPPIKKIRYDPLIAIEKLAKQFDEKTAFIYDDLIEEILKMEPEEFDDKSGPEFLNRFCGSKQAPKCLNEKRFACSKEMNFIEKADPCVLVRQTCKDSYTEEEKGSPVEMTEDGLVIERMRSEEIINCTCGFREEDGLMIQCDICLCWQHGICCNIESDVQVPERYVCYICRHPYRVRSSAKYEYAVHYLTMGKLPTFSFRSKDERVIRERENLIKKCFDLTSNLHQMGNVGQSLAVKLKIAERRDHPKLYLWAKNWRNNADKREQPEDATKSVIPEPEAPIDFEDCRERLVKDVENNLQTLDERLNLISNQINCLEAQASGSGQSEANLSSKTIKQTLATLTKDLKDLEKLAVISQP